MWRLQWLPARVCAHLDTPNRSTAEDALDLVRMDDDGLADGGPAGLMALGARRPGKVMPSSHEPPLQNAAFIASFILMTEALSAVSPTGVRTGRRR